jgi:hypothetical protein
MFLSLPVLFPLCSCLPLGIGDILARAGAMEAGAQASGIAIVPLRNSGPVVEEVVFIARFDGKFIEDAEHGGVLPDALIHGVVEP